MFFPGPKSAVCAVWLFASMAPNAATSQTKREKSVWRYDGGVIFVTDGSLPNGVCFRVNGEVNAGDFFDNLKRVDDEHGTVFLRGTKTVSEFPRALDVSFAIHDRPCTPGLHDIPPRTHLTLAMMSHLQLSIYWKHGVDLRLVKDVMEVETRVEIITPSAKEFSAELPQRFERSYQLAVPSGGVPLPS